MAADDVARLEGDASPLIASLREAEQAMSAFQATASRFQATGNEGNSAQATAAINAIQASLRELSDAYKTAGDAATRFASTTTTPRPNVSSHGFRDETGGPLGPQLDAATKQAQRNIASVAAEASKSLGQELGSQIRTVASGVIRNLSVAAEREYGVQRGRIADVFQVRNADVPRGGTRFAPQQATSASGIYGPKPSQAFGNEVASRLEQNKPLGQLVPPSSTSAANQQFIRENQVAAEAADKRLQVQREADAVAARAAAQENARSNATQGQLTQINQLEERHNALLAERNRLAAIQVPTSKIFESGQLRRGQRLSEALGGYQPEPRTIAGGKIDQRAAAEDFRGAQNQRLIDLDRAIEGTGNDLRRLQSTINEAAAAASVFSNTFRRVNDNAGFNTQTGGFEKLVRDEDGIRRRQPVTDNADRAALARQYETRNRALDVGALSDLRDRAQRGDGVKPIFGQEGKLVEDERLQRAVDVRTGTILTGAETDRVLQAAETRLAALYDAAAREDRVRSATRPVFGQPDLRVGADSIVSNVQTGRSLSPGRSELVLERSRTALANAQSREAADSIRRSAESRRDTSTNFLFGSQRFAQNQAGVYDLVSRQYLSSGRAAVEIDAAQRRLATVYGQAQREQVRRDQNAEAQQRRMFTTQSQAERENSRRDDMVDRSGRRMFGVQSQAEREDARRTEVSQVASVVNRANAGDQGVRRLPGADNLIQDRQLGQVVNERTQRILSANDASRALEAADLRLAAAETAAYREAEARGAAQRRLMGAESAAYREAESQGAAQRRLIGTQSRAQNENTKFDNQRVGQQADAGNTRFQRVFDKPGLVEDKQLGRVINEVSGTMLGQKQSSEVLQRAELKLASLYDAAAKEDRLRSSTLPVFGQPDLRRNAATGRVSNVQSGTEYSQGRSDLILENSRKKYARALDQSTADQIRRQAESPRAADTNFLTGSRRYVENLNGVFDLTARQYLSAGEATHQQGIAAARLKTAQDKSAREADKAEAQRLVGQARTGGSARFLTPNVVQDTTTGEARNAATGKLLSAEQTAAAELAAGARADNDRAAANRKFQEALETARAQLLRSDPTVQRAGLYARQTDSTGRVRDFKFTNADETRAQAVRPQTEGQNKADAAFNRLAQAADEQALALKLTTALEQGLARRISANIVAMSGDYYGLKNGGERATKLQGFADYNAQQADPRQRGLAANFLGGLTSRGFGGAGGGFDLGGLAQAAGTTVKYTALYSALNLVQQGAQQAAQELLNYEDSIAGLSLAYRDNAEPSQLFINDLQDIAAKGGVNVGDIMDQAAVAMRAFGGATGSTNDQLDDFATSFAGITSQLALISGQDLTTVGNQLRAATSSTAGGDATLQQSTFAAQAYADSVAGAYKNVGGDFDDIADGYRAIATTATNAGFSSNETANLIAATTSRLGESGQLAGTRLQRVFSIISGSAGQNALRELNQTLSPDKQIDLGAGTADQVRQLNAVYSTLSEKQQQALINPLAGTSGSGELTVLLESKNVLEQNGDAYDYAGSAAEEYARRANSLSGYLKQLKGNVTGIATALSQSGIIGPLKIVAGTLLEITKLVRTFLQGVNALTSGFGKIPGVVKEIGVSLLAIYAIMRLIQGVRNRGGLGALVGRGTAIISPQRALAQQQLAQMRAAGTLTSQQNLPTSGRYGLFGPQIQSQAGANRQRLLNNQETARQGVVAAGAASRTAYQDVRGLQRQGVLESDQRLIAAQQRLLASTQALTAAQDVAKRANQAVRNDIRANGLGQRITPTFAQRPLGNPFAATRDGIRAGLASARNQGPTLRQSIANARQANPAPANAVTRQQFANRVVAAQSRVSILQNQRINTPFGPNALINGTQLQVAQKALATAIAQQARLVAPNAQNSNLTRTSRLVGNVANSVDSRGFTRAAASLRGLQGSLDASARSSLALRSGIAAFRSGSVSAVQGVQRLTAAIRNLGRQSSSSAAGSAFRQSVGNFGNELKSALGGIGGILIAIQLLTSAASAAKNYVKTDESVQNQLGLTAETGSADEYTANATAQRQAAESAKEAASGFFGTLTDLIAGNTLTNTAHALEEAATANEAAATRAADAAKRNAESSRPVLNVTSADTLSESIKSLQDTGRGAITIMDAFANTLRDVAAAANGGVKALSAEDISDLSKNAGGVASQVATDFATDLKNGQNIIQQSLSAGIGGDNPTTGNKVQQGILDSILTAIPGGVLLTKPARGLVNKLIPGSETPDKLRNLSDTQQTTFDTGVEAATQTVLEQGVDLSTAKGKQALNDQLTANLTALFEALGLSPSQIQEAIQRITDKVANLGSKAQKSNTSGGLTDTQSAALAAQGYTAAQNAASVRGVNNALNTQANPNVGQELFTAKDLLGQLQTTRGQLVAAGASQKALEAFNDQINAQKLAVQTATVNNLQALGALAQASIPSQDTQSQLSSQLNNLSQQYNATTEAGARLGIQTQSIQTAQQLYVANQAAGQAQGLADKGIYDKVGQSEINLGTANQNLERIQNGYTLDVNGKKVKIAGEDRSAAEAEARTAQAQAERDNIDAQLSKRAALQRRDIDSRDTVGNARQDLQEAGDAFVNIPVTAVEQRATAYRAMNDKQNAFNAALIEQSKQMARLAVDPRDTLGNLNQDFNDLATDLAQLPNTADFSGQRAAIQREMTEKQQAIDLQIVDDNDTLARISIDSRDIIGNLRQDTAKLQATLALLPSTPEFAAQRAAILRDISEKQQAIDLQIVSDNDTLARLSIDSRDVIGNLRQDASKLQATLALLPDTPEFAAQRAALLKEIQDKNQNITDAQIEQSATIAESKIDPRDTIGKLAVDRAKLVAQLIALGDNPALESLRAALRTSIAQNDIDSTAAISARNNASNLSTLQPGDDVGQAREQLRYASEQLKNAKSGTKEYYDLLTQVKQARVDLATAEANYASNLRKLTIDITNPVQSALADLQAAQDQVNALINAGASNSQVAAARVSVNQAKAQYQQAEFNEEIYQIQTAESLDRISHGEAMKRYRTLRAQLAAQLSGLKTTDTAYDQISKEIDQIDQALKSAADSMSSQFNIGDIRVPTPFEVRRSIDQQLKGAGVVQGGNTSTANYITINGGDIAQVMAVVAEALGTTGTYSSSSAASTNYKLFTQ